jgi:hypothetical protein
MSEPTKNFLQAQIHVLEVERNELTVNLAIARCDAYALEAEVQGLRVAVAALQKGNEAQPQ